MRGRPRGRGPRAAAHGPLTPSRDPSTAELLWYAGYGSNTLVERLETYLTGSGAGDRFGAHPPFAGGGQVDRTAWIRSDHPLYFAGRSVRWDGAVALLGLRPREGVVTWLRAYRVTPAQLAHVATVENNVGTLAWDGRPGDLAVGAHRRLPLPDGLEPARGKYDAVLRLPDLDGLPVLTLTTTRHLEPGAPGAAYRAVVAAGLSDAGLGTGPGDDAAVAAYLDAAVARGLAGGARDDGARAAACRDASNTCSA